MLTWSYDDGEVSFHVGTEHRGTGTAAKPDDQCTDIDEDSQECQDAVRTTLTLEQQDGCQSGRNYELQPGGAHKEETGVSLHVRKPHVRETGVNRHVREPHVGETGVNRQIGKPHVGEIGDSRHIEEPDRISAELPSEQRKQLDVHMITSRIEKLNGIVEAGRIGHGSTFSRKWIPNRACQRMQSGVCV